MSAVYRENAWKSAWLQSAWGLSEQEGLESNHWERSAVPERHESKRSGGSSRYERSDLPGGCERKEGRVMMGEWLYSEMVERSPSKNGSAVEALFCLSDLWRAC